MIDGIDIQALAREIAARMDPLALLDADDAAAMVKCSRRQWLERHAKHRDCPPAVRLLSKDSDPRWQRADIATYIERRRGDAAPKNPGRPRRKVVL